MKRTLAVLLVLIAVISLCCCSKQNLADMTTSVTDDYAAIVWGDKIYVPYGALVSYGDRGEQIGIVDGNENHKVYACKGYSSDEWIVAAFSYDAAMLLREINVTEIPEGWESEYEWNP